MNPIRKQTPKSRSEQLAAMLARPNGVRTSVIGARFGWQAHSVRAAVSGLRKNGLEVLTSRSAKSGETIYALQRKPNVDTAEPITAAPVDDDASLLAQPDHAEEDALLSAG